MSSVEYQSLSKDFGSVEVIRDLSLTVNEGEFVVLLGASGCGKTTLLRMTAGLETISGGDLFIGGKHMNEVHPRDRNIAMVFQNYALYPTMKVFDNIAFSLQVNKVGADEVRRRVEAAAAVLNLTEFLGRYPRELSGGQRQRVAMGRAMVREPQVFLFDEPLSNLDAKLRAHMRIEIRQLHGRLGTTTIYVTHDQIEAMTMADKIVLMNEGRIEQVGTPDELFDSPATRFVADFIGSPSMNFLDGSIEADGDASFFAARGLRIPIAEKIEANSSVCAGLRPTDLMLEDDGPIVGEVTVLEKTGADVNLHIRTETGSVVATVTREVQIAAGDTVRFAINSQKLHLFESSGGASLRRAQKPRK